MDKNRDPYWKIVLGLAIYLIVLAWCGSPDDDPIKPRVTEVKPARTAILGNCPRGMCPVGKKPLGDE